MNDQCLNCRIRKSCYYKEPEEDWTCEHYGYFNGLLGELDEEKPMGTKKIKVCPYLTYTEVRPAILKGHGDVTVMGFMDCIKEDCPAFYRKQTGGESATPIFEERCRRLEESSGGDAP